MRELESIVDQGGGHQVAVCRSQALARLALVVSQQRDLVGQLAMSEGAANDSLGGLPTAADPYDGDPGVAPDCACFVQEW
jgi:hypothetical protein